MRGQFRFANAMIGGASFANSNRTRLGFSLLEVIIATAVLVGSAMVLMSSIGASARFGSLAKQRIYALNAAQTVLDEYGLSLANDSPESEVAGTIDGRERLAYRLIASQINSIREQRSDASSRGLLRLTVEIFESEQALKSGASEPLCRLTRWIRAGQEKSLRDPLGEPGGDSQFEASPGPGGSNRPTVGR